MSWSTSSRPSKAQDHSAAFTKCSATACVSGHCDKPAIKATPAQTKQPLPLRGCNKPAAPCDCGNHEGNSTRRFGPALLRARHSVIHCMLCDTSGHTHGTVRLIFEPMGSFQYHHGQILSVLLPGSCGLEILITSHPQQAGVMHGKLLIAKGASLPAQFGPDAAFGLMFQVCCPQRSHSS